MKKLILLLFITFSTLVTYSQVIGTGSYKSYYKTYTDIDYLFVFNGIDNSTELIFNGQTSSMDSVKWYYFSDPTTPISLQSPQINTNVEDATGYILDVLDVDGNHKKYTIWVLDYKKIMPVFNSLTSRYEPNNQCDGLMLDLDANIPLVQYKSLAGTTHTINRIFTLSYSSKEWDKSSEAWLDKNVTETINLPKTAVEVLTTPLCDTRFKIEGDRFASDLLISPLPFIESNIYSAVAVEAHITSSAAARTELHEGDRPGLKSISGSAPLDIMFESNGNIPVTEFYQWEIFKDNSLLYTRSDKDQRYTFTESGTYKVRLKVSN